MTCSTRATRLCRTARAVARLFPTMKLLSVTTKRPTHRSLSACRWWISPAHRCWCGRPPRGRCLATWPWPRIPMWNTSRWNAHIEGGKTEKLILAKALLEKVFRGEEVKVAGHVQGQKVEGTEVSSTLHLPASRQACPLCGAWRIRHHRGWHGTRPHGARLRRGRYAGRAGISTCPC